MRDLIEWTSKDAVRFFLLSRKPDTEYVFDVDLALAQNNDWTGNPIYIENVIALDAEPGVKCSRDSATPWARGVCGGDQRRCRRHRLHAWRMVADARSDRLSDRVTAVQR